MSMSLLYTGESRTGPSTPGVSSPVLGRGGRSPPSTGWQHSLQCSPGYHLPPVQQEHIAGSWSLWSPPGLHREQKSLAVAANSEPPALKTTPFSLSSLLSPNKATPPQQLRSVGGWDTWSSSHRCTSCRGFAPLLSIPPLIPAQGDHRQEGRYLLPCHTKTWSHFPATLHTSFSRQLPPLHCPAAPPECCRAWKPSSQQEEPDEVWALGAAVNSPPGNANGWILPSLVRNCNGSRTADTTRWFWG